MRFFHPCGTWFFCVLDPSVETLGYCQAKNTPNLHHAPANADMTSISENQSTNDYYFGVAIMSEERLGCH